MPIFDFKCSGCGRQVLDALIRKEEEIPVCCQNQMEKIPARIHSGFPEFGITLENVAEKPVHFSSKRQMQDYARKNNLELGALL